MYVDTPPSAATRLRVGAAQHSRLTEGATITDHSHGLRVIQPAIVKRPHQLKHIGFTLSQRESYASSGVKLLPPHDIVTQTSPLHVGVAESMQSADADYVVTTAAVATMVLPVKGIVEDIAVGSSTGAVDTHIVSAVSIHVYVVVHAAGVGREVLVHRERTSY